MSVVARPRVEDGLRRGVLGGHLETQTSRVGPDDETDAWSRADKQGQKAPGISEENRTLDAILIVLKGEMDAAKSESEAKTADKKQKAVQERVEIEVARSIRKRAIGRAQPAEVDEDANPFTSRRATEVRHQIEAASGDVVEAGTRMANTVNAPKKVRGPGKKRKNDADFMFFRDGRE
jgi:hypothetical protein